ncbi:MAG: hypothetical protein H7145_18880 [Akkermansiaceae bacterium]|nr:hypothetical protein [Armatimonadota bacterium]
MRIVLKPLGVITIIGAIILLALLAFRSSSLRNAATSRSPTPTGTGATPPVSNGETAAEGELTVYTDGLENGWQERGWAKVIDYANASPVRGSVGTSIRVEAAPYEAVKIYNPAADLSSYRHLVFFLHGGNEGGQVLTVATVAAGKTQKGVPLAPLPANKWVRVIVPLSELGIQGRRDVNAFWLQDASAAPAVFHIDDIQFRVTPPDGVPEETLALSPTATSTVKQNL